MTRKPITPDPPDGPDEETPLEELNRLLRDERRRWRYRFAGVVLVGAIGAGFLVRSNAVADEANKAATKAQHAIDLANEQRDEARLGACNAFNDDLAANVNGLNDEVQQLAVDAFADPTGRRTPEQNVQVATFLKQKQKAFENRKVPQRDCTPEGIAAFYAAKAAG